MLYADPERGLRVAGKKVERCRREEKERMKSHCLFPCPHSSESHEKRLSRLSIEDAHPKRI